jgi:hypothetical protein
MISTTTGAFATARVDLDAAPPRRMTAKNQGLARQLLAE